MQRVQSAIIRPRQTGKPRVLDVGSGVSAKSIGYPAFLNWEAVRLDINPRVKPDVLGSAVNLRGLVEDASFDAIWSSHQMEHLYDHDVLRALSEFVRVLKPNGFALVTCPDLEAVAQLVVQGKVEQAAYHSPAGPITALDMLFGHRGSIADGNEHMAHRTGFTKARLGAMMIKAGFNEVWTSKGQSYDLWAVGLMPRAERQLVSKRVSQNADRYVPFFS